MQRGRRRQVWRENPRADGYMASDFPAVRTLDSTSDEEIARGSNKQKSQESNR